MNTKLKKIVCILILLVMVFNVFMPVVSMGVTPEEKEEQTFDAIGGGIMVLDGIAGILTYGLKLQVLVLGILVQGVGTIAGSIAGTPVDYSGINFLSPDMILFNKLPITSINFFDFKYSVIDQFGNGKSMSTTNPIYVIRDNISIWYYSIRNLAIVILLCVLIYVGIRMAISTIAEDKAKYKKMFFDWLVSIILVFVMHYIIVITININNMLVDLLWKSSGIGAGGGVLDGYIGKILGKAFHWQMSVGWGATIVYCILVGISLAFLLMYIKRMITIGFLILISPLITVTYSIDKMGDNSSQALDAWLKEFVYNILIQPFHCLIYLVFASVSIALLDQGTIGNSIVAICCLLFIFKAEDIVRTIFNFKKASSLGTAVAAGAALMGGMSAIKGLGGDVKKAAGGASRGGSLKGGSGKGGASGAKASGGKAPKGGSPKGGVSKSGISSGRTTGGGTPSGSTLGSGNADSKGIKGVAKTAGKFGLNAGKKILKPSKLASKIAFGAMGAALSEKHVVGAMGGIALGEKFNDVVGGKYDKVRNAQVARKRESNLVNSYQQVLANNGGDRDVVDEKASSYIKMNDRAYDNMMNGTRVDEYEKQFAMKVRQLGENYQKMGQDQEAAIEAMLDTFDRIDLGKILPPKNKK